MKDCNPVPSRLELIGVDGLPLIESGDDLAALLANRLDELGMALEDGDVVVFAQKVVSKAEGRLVELNTIKPSPDALALAKEADDKDPRLIELILEESRRIVRQRGSLIIAEHRLGYVMANAGIDQSNIGGKDCALLLPEDPDASAQRLRAELGRRCGCLPGVVINDSFGRPWRLGSVGVAIGCAGLAALQDLRGETDLFGRELLVTEVAHADEIAAAASLLMGQAAESIPVVIVRGLTPQGDGQPATVLVRNSSEDLFR